ncbi:hypothetical protein EHW66_13695 [Erwinia psidii]|uniref:DUF3472 domain-containing protein n=1 Tax=Erwinia psidii TaxID=69224 RepID=UPI00226B6BA0|nr:hypothetical protein [Erwinia psidii]MCX8962858.1 hypothetical protein [Erwinia psidii]MCX8966005.1 hypothetical protein [Erwinia psidii]
MRKINFITGVFSLFFIVSDGNAMSSTPQNPWAGQITNFMGSMPDNTQGYKVLSYPIKVMSGKKEQGFYYSQYVFFKHPGDQNAAYYMGIQPWGDNQAKVIFSVFGANVEKQDPKCTDEADHKNGSSCYAFMPFEYDVEYKFIATLVSSTSSGNIWEGYAVNTVSNDARRIGSWKTPTAWGLLSGKSIGFIEHFLSIENCSLLPATSALFGPGVGSVSTAESVTGKLTAAYSAISEPCKGKIPFSSTIQADGSLLVRQDKGIN